MDTKPKNFFTTYGLLIGGLSIITTLLMYLLAPEMLSKSWVGIIWLLLYIIAGTLAVNAFKKANKGYASFGQAFKQAFFTMAIATIVSTIFTLLLYKVIDPNFYNEMMDAQMEKQMEKMESRGIDSSANMEKGMEVMKKWGTIIMIGVTLFYLMVQAAISAVIGAVTKKDRPALLDEI